MPPKKGLTNNQLLGILVIANKKLYYRNKELTNMLETGLTAATTILLISGATILGISLAVYFK